MANITSTNFISTLDLTSGNFQIAVKPDDVTKPAFITKKGCFTFKRMSFGLSGAPSNFQKAMNTILRSLLGKGVLLYLDDIIVMAAIREEYLMLLRKVFTLLRNAGLSEKLEKCKFLRKQII